MADDQQPAPPPVEGTFTCAACGGTFPKARSDEEAKAESEENFGEIPEEEVSVICGDCYEIMMKRALAAGWKPGDPA